MMLRILLIAATVHGAAIPQNPSCLEKCLVAGGIVGAAADLNFFKSVAVDINNFCNVYTALLKCASGCSQDDLNLVMKHTMHASYVCKEKLEEIKTVHDCLESDTTDPLSDCSKVCEVTEHVPLRLDSTATAPVNPNVPAEGTGPLCGKQMCVLKCAREQLNKQCAGAGDLFKEIARHQVEIGWDMLQAQSENTNDTASQLVALSYLANIPEKCVYLTNLETFDKEIGGDMMKKPEMMPGMEFSNDTTIESESSADSATSPGMGGFDPTLFEFAPVLEPDVPLGPPSGDVTTTDATTEMINTPPEEEVKVLGGEKDKITTIFVEETEAPVEEEEEQETTTVPPTTTSTTTVAPVVAPSSQSGSLAAAVDAPTESMDKMEGGVHEQPKPADAPVAGGSAETDESMDEPAETETTDASADKEAAMGTRPVTSESSDEGPSGLVPSRPVTEEDKDKEVDESALPPKTTEFKVTLPEGGIHGDPSDVKVVHSESTDDTTEEATDAEGEKAEEGATGMAAAGKTGESMDGKTEEAEKTDDEMADDNGDAVEKEVEDGTAMNKDSEGSEMSTDSTIVVDDENESELEKNEINPVTEKAKINSAGSVSVFAALFALVVAMFI